jgi:hypothetical protein
MLLGRVWIFGLALSAETPVLASNPGGLAGSHTAALTLATYPINRSALAPVFSPKSKKPTLTGFGSVTMCHLASALRLIPASNLGNALCSRIRAWLGCVKLCITQTGDIAECAGYMLVKPTNSAVKSAVAVGWLPVK